MKCLFCSREAPSIIYEDTYNCAHCITIIYTINQKIHSIYKRIIVNNQHWTIHWKIADNILYMENYQALSNIKTIVLPLNYNITPDNITEKLSMILAFS